MPVRLAKAPGQSGACERAIRPFVIGRNGWLFSDTVRGAQASANLYSLMETAKANGHEPYRYLRHVFAELPKAQPAEQLAALLPYNIEPGAPQPWGWGEGSDKS